MLLPPIQATIEGNAPAVALLKTGNGPVRFYGFGEAPQNTALPYAAWQVAYGNPENHLSEVPNTDFWTIQVDVYGAPSPAGQAGVIAVATAIRDAIEPVAYITAWRPQGRDPETRNYRISFDSDWIKAR